MIRQNPLLDQPLESNDPFGLSKLSLRRYSVQYLLMVLVVIGLLVATNVQAALHGNLTLRILAATMLGVTLAKTVFLIYVGGRTIAVEAWIRRLGMGDFEYRIEPRGRDEVSKSCEALETLRQSSIRAMQLDLVQELSDELREKNIALEDTLDELKSAQDRIVSQQKLAELGELSAGVAHEIRNPLQFIRNFASSSRTMVHEVGEMSRQPEIDDPEGMDELTRVIGENMERIVAHTDRADRTIADMLAMGRRSTRDLRIRRSEPAQSREGPPCPSRGTGPDPGLRRHCPPRPRSGPGTGLRGGGGPGAPLHQSGDQRLPRHGGAGRRLG